jgi:hypothetical protein
VTVSPTGSLGENSTLTTQAATLVTPAHGTAPAGAPYRLGLAGVLRKGRNLGPVVGRRRLDAEHGTDEAPFDTAVLHRRAPVLGRAHERSVREAAACEELGHVEPAQAAPEQRTLLVLGQALQLLDRTRQRMHCICKTVAALVDPLVNRDRLELLPELLGPKFDARCHLAAVTEPSQYAIVQRKERARVQDHGLDLHALQTRLLDNALDGGIRVIGRRAELVLGHERNTKANLRTLRNLDLNRARGVDLEHLALDLLL